MRSSHITALHRPSAGTLAGQVLRRCTAAERLRLHRAQLEVARPSEPLSDPSPNGDRGEGLACRRRAVAQLAFGHRPGRGRALQRLDPCANCASLLGPRRLVWPRTPAFHAGNVGSNPAGDAAYLPAESSGYRRGLGTVNRRVRTNGTCGGTRVARFAEALHRREEMLGARVSIALRHPVRRVPEQVADGARVRAFHAEAGREGMP